MTVRIFLSSTYLDLQPERKAVEQVLHRFRETKFVGMEYFGSRDETTQRASLDEVDRSDCYLGLFGGRYGSGITENEYRRARERKLPCFAYCKDDSLIPAEWRETDQGKIVKFAQLMGDLRQHHTVQSFTTPADLATKVAMDLHRWLFDNYLTPRLEQAARGERPRHEANALLNDIKDWDALSPELLGRLKSAGFVVASGQGNVAIGGNVSGSVINTGNDNFTLQGGINIKGDGNAVGHHNIISVTKTTKGMTTADFAALLTQIRTEIPNLPERHRASAETNLATVEAELQEPKPDGSLIESSMKKVESLFKKAESTGATRHHNVESLNAIRERLRILNTISSGFGHIADVEHSELLSIEDDEPAMVSLEEDSESAESSSEEEGESAESLLEEEGESAEAAKLHFRLEGQEAIGNQVKCSSEVDLLFAYDKITQPVLGVVEGQKLTEIIEQRGALGLTIIPKGFTTRDGVWRQIAQFTNGRLESPVRFQLKAASEVVKDAHIHVIFDKAGALLYAFNLAIELVTAFRLEAFTHLETPEMNLDERLAVKEDSRTANLILAADGDKINYKYWRQDSPGHLSDGDFKKITRTVLADKLGKIRSTLQGVTDHTIWSLVGYRIDEAKSAGEKKAFQECLERLATAGSSLYFALAEDEDFKRVLDKVNALEPGSRLSIYTDCAFLPWEILYPHRYNIGFSDESKKANPIQVQDFWGYRFAIECLLKPKDDDYDPPLNAHRAGKTFISYNFNPTIDKDFAEMDFKPVADQEVWAKQLDANKFKVEVNNRGADIKKMLQTPGYEATMIYLYCHGRNDQPFQDDKSESLELDTNVFLDPEMLMDGSKFKYGPIVFLNSCGSGAFSPLSLSSFLTCFCEKEALGLIASNFPVPATFAAKFGGNIIQNYIQPPTKTIGDVMLEERRRLLDHNNPLGLFYSLQCPMGITARVD